MLVIIHGWSDSSRSFTKLGRRLVEEGVAAGVKHVRLGDYLSLDDDVTFDDLAQALQKAWVQERLPTAPRSVDAVVHSTGGLVLRHWMTRYHTASTVPLKRVLMLAPANFGSPLAHKGRSFIGRVVKGFKGTKPFQTGTHLLRGLELASPFAWDLAMRDRFGPDTWYGPGKILCTVLVGTSGYTGISAAANEGGSDGTVRVATANLNPGLVAFDFVTDPQKPTVKVQAPKGLTAFARLARVNHGSITLNEGPVPEALVPLMVGALQVEDAGFDAWATDLDARSEADRVASENDRYCRAYQDTVVRVTDSHGVAVRDYFLELFAKNEKGRPDDRATARLQTETTNTVHANDEDPSLRSLLLHAGGLKRDYIDAGRPLYVSITAHPDLRETKTVGYETLGYDDIGSIRLTPEKLKAFLRPDATVLVDLRLRRVQEDEVFRFSAL